LDAEVIVRKPLSREGSGLFALLQAREVAVNKHISAPVPEIGPFHRPFCVHISENIAYHLLSARPNRPSPSSFRDHPGRTPLRFATTSTAIKHKLL
jgi:hypothetical protein